jgi:signal transduction histidine kinase
MINRAITKLTIQYIFIVSIICLLVSTFIYNAIVKTTSEALRMEEIKIMKRFDISDPAAQKKLQIAENTIENFKNRTFITLVFLNISIITLVGFFAYFLARKNIQPIEENMHRQKEFISNVSHELKTPLTALKSSFEVELRDKNPDMKRAIESGIEEVDKLNKLINGFLKLSKLGQEKYKLNLEEMDLKEILDEVVKNHINQIIDKRIQLEYHLKEKTILTDHFLITELLSVILSNSIKFNKNYGKIEIKSYKKDGKDYIEITDSGIGIEKENISHIFERFYQENNARNNDGSYGIGLSIANEILKILNGKIVVKSEKNIETKITLIFSGLFKK